MATVLVVLAIALLMMLVEILRPARNWPKVKTWWPRAIALNLVQVGSVFVAGYLWDPHLHRLRPWTLDELGVFGGGVVGYLVITFVYYWWHRFRHEVPFLWRWFHQTHHSPQRIEIITSFYKHPFEIFANALLSSVIVYGLLGLSPQAGAFAVLLSGLAELVYHWNVRTPYWLGYIFQRPESHCVHHQEGVHSFNFADLPLWDILFGTFRNPRDWQGKCGFGSEDEHQLTRMLRGMDWKQNE